MGILRELFKRKTEEEKKAEELKKIRIDIEKGFFNLINYQKKTDELKAVYKEIPFQLIPETHASDYLLLLETYKLALESNIPLYDCNLAMLRLNKKVRGLELERRKLLGKELEAQLSIIKFEQ